ncbi:hypothetical protein Pcinc_042895 [Petrolisthes cinctipes]|uniref:Uncharacterized protein n=1 Tax=Petrolisthes cinctipes TaxID=88211 RepID=A0AAE1BGL4_PETCI|nr:hypothetical protein Pcinc_042895 [Petrolisthes cinctipes]
MSPIARNERVYEVPSYLASNSNIGRRQLSEFEEIAGWRPFASVPLTGQVERTDGRTFGQLQFFLHFVLILPGPLLLLLLLKGLGIWPSNQAHEENKRQRPWTPENGRRRNYPMQHSPVPSHPYQFPTQPPCTPVILTSSSPHPNPTL